MAATARAYDVFDGGPADSAAPARPADRMGLSRGGAAPAATRRSAPQARPHVTSQDAPEPAPEAPPAPVIAARAPFVTLVLVLVAAGIVGLLVLNTKINENSFQLEGLRDRQVALDAREQQLASQLADKQSPGNLAAAAKRLGLVPAGSPAFLVLPDGRVLGVPHPGGVDNPSGR